MTALRERMADYYRRNETRLSIGFFLGGFLFDILTLSDIDNPIAIAQQVLYFWIVGALLYREFLFSLNLWAPAGRGAGLWRYRTLLVHFLLGSLLSIYSLFFLKSASLASSLGFIALIMGILVANELPRVQSAGVGLKIALYVLCVFSFFSMLWPVALGFVGRVPFVLAVICTAGIMALVFRRLARRVPDPRVLRRALTLPTALTLGAAVVFYWVGWIPPVPLAVERMGIYHGVERQGDRYVLRHERPWWAVWRDGDQDFAARPGESVYFYAEIYAPRRFSDEVFLRWMWKDPKKGWTTSDRIPLRVVGGRKGGFRGFANKQNHWDGDWRVKVETTDGREIGRMRFRRRALDLPPDPGRFRVEYR